MMRARIKQEFERRLARHKEGLTLLASNPDTGEDLKKKIKALMGQLTTWEIDLQRPLKSNSLPKLQWLYDLILNKEPNRELIEQAAAKLEEKYRSQAESYQITSALETRLRQMEEQLKTAAKDRKNPDRPAVRSLLRKTRRWLKTIDDIKQVLNSPEYIEKKHLQMVKDDMNNITQAIEKARHSKKILPLANDSRFFSAGGKQAAKKKTAAASTEKRLKNK